MRYRDGPDIGDLPAEGAGDSSIVLVTMQVMLDCHVEEQSDMGIGDAVIDLPALFPSLDEAGETKLA